MSDPSGNGMIYYDLNNVRYLFCLTLVVPAKKEEPKKEKKTPQAAAKALRKKKRKGVSAVVKIPTSKFICC